VYSFKAFIYAVEKFTLSMVDRGEFTLAPEFAHYRMNAHVYEEKTDKQEKRMAISSCGR